MVSKIHTTRRDETAYLSGQDRTQHSRRARSFRWATNWWWFAADFPEATDRARQTLALLPALRRWVTARVARAGADAGLSLRQYAALTGIRQGLPRQAS